MEKHNITYERNANTSFMKVPAIQRESLDEKLILCKKYRGVISLEKCYVNGDGQYWYNITGMQALDTFCKINLIEQKFFEMLIFRICSQLEILEWNLLDASCMVMDPEFIFITPNGDEVFFVLYPESQGEFWGEFQKLMEYLLTKINHTDREGVKQSYKIYEMILTKTFQMEDIKHIFLKEKEEVVEQIEPLIESSVESVATEEENWFLKMENSFKEWIEKTIGYIRSGGKTSEEIPMVVYPEEEIEEKQEISINPTICLTGELQEAQGILVYEGMDAYPDFKLQKEMCILGKNPGLKLCLDKDTISQFHAKFEYIDKNYYIEDINSTNGTVVNEIALNYKEKKALFPGDLIRFADVKYRFL